MTSSGIFGGGGKGDAKFRPQPPPYANLESELTAENERLKTEVAAKASCISGLQLDKAVLEQEIRERTAWMIAKAVARQQMTSQLGVAHQEVAEKTDCLAVSEGHVMALTNMLEKADKELRDAYDQGIAKGKLDEFTRLTPIMDQLKDKLSQNRII